MNTRRGRLFVEDGIREVTKSPKKQQPETGKRILLVDGIPVFNISDATIEITKEESVQDTGPFYSYIWSIIVKIPYQGDGNWFFVKREIQPLARQYTGWFENSILYISIEHRRPAGSPGLDEEAKNAAKEALKQDVVQWLQVEIDRLREEATSIEGGF